MKINPLDPLVTVFLPVFNASRFLPSWWKNNESELRSVEARLLVVDNGSEDDTVKLIESFNYDNIKIICNNQNLGLEESKKIAKQNIYSKYRMLLPADDWLAEGYLRTALGIMEANDSIRVAYGRSFTVDLVSGLSRERFRPPRIIGTYSESFFNAFLFNNFITDISLFRSEDLCQDRSSGSWMLPGGRASLLKKGPVHYMGIPQCFSGKRKDQVSKSYTQTGYYYVKLDNVFRDFQCANELSVVDKAFLFLIYNNFYTGEQFLPTLNRCLTNGSIYVRIGMGRNLQGILSHVFLALIDDLLLDPFGFRMRKSGRFGSAKEVMEIIDQLDSEHRGILNLHLKLRGCEVDLT